MIIGYTTGVFDLFHIGHLNIIREAKKRCDYLIVAVSNDKLALKLKKKKKVIH
jgi:glycerol-3-phosphate cytidylyltransferase